jgi:CHAT domain-containing protein
MNVFTFAFMRSGVVIQLIIALLSTAILHGQCPSKDSINKSISSAYNSKSLTEQEKLVKLHESGNMLKKCFSVNDSSYSSLLRKIGFLYSDMKDFVKGADYLQQSINIINANISSPSVKPKDLISTYYWLSTFHGSLNNTAEEISAADKCITVAGELKEYLDVSFIRSLLIKVEHSFDIGDYYQCISTAELCERYASEYIKTMNRPYDNNAMKGIANSCIGWHVNVLLQSGEFSKADQLLTNKVNEYKKEKLHDYLALTYTQLAKVYIEKKDFSKALSYYTKAFDTYRDNGADFSCKQTLNETGRIIYFEHLNNGNMALAYYNKALQFKKKGEHNDQAGSLETLALFGNIANVYLHKRMYDSAFKYFQLAFDQLMPGINETGVVKSSPKEFLKYKKIQYLSSLVIDKGDAFLAKYKHTGIPAAAIEAMRIYKAADMLLNRIRTGQSDLKSKLLWRSDSRRLYEHAVELCYLQNNIADAFYFFERSRAVLLSDQLNEQRGLGSSEISKRVQVSKRILNLQVEADSTARDSKRYADIQNELFANTQEKQHLEEAIRVNNPLYYQGIDTNYITLADVKTKLLKDHQAVAELFSGDSAVYSLLITSGHNYFNRINKKEFDSTVQSYSNYISDIRLLNSDFAGFRRVSGHLYKLIFQNGIVPGGRIIISMGDRYFPFESLITGNSGADPVYFLADHAVSYTYSARYLMNDFSSGNITAKGYFLGVAPVQYKYAVSLPQLTGSDGSLKTITSYISSSHRQVGEDASRNNFLQAFAGYAIIQLYTHASDSSSRKEPVIYLADSALYLSELISGNKPVTRLIVLSACQTGNGLLYQGEGVFSFNRGFAALGIPSCIANLWSVDNISTYRITEYFYKYLAKGDPLDVALQKAKLEFLATASGENKLPFYWAPAVLVGKSDPIKYNKPGYWKVFLFTALLAVTIIWGLSRYNRKTK